MEEEEEKEEEEEEVKEEDLPAPGRVFSFAEEGDDDDDAVTWRTDSRPPTPVRP